MTPEQKSKYNQAAKARMKKLRERRKTETFSKPKTRSELLIEEEVKKTLRMKWREQKQRRMENMTNEDKVMHRSKRRKAYQKKKMKEGRISNMTVPQSPKSFADFIEEIIVINSTPRKKNELLKRGIIQSPDTRRNNKVQQAIGLNCRRQLQMLKGAQDKSSRHFTKNILRTVSGESDELKTDIQKYLGVRSQTWDKYTKVRDLAKSRKPTKAEEEIINYYETCSVILPTKKTVNRHKIQKKVLEYSTKRLHSKFFQATNIPVSITHFRKLKPKHVLHVSKNRFYVCLCEYCLNIRLKLTVRAFFFFYFSYS